MIPDIQSPTFTQRLSDSGLRSTPQREFVYQVILGKRDHPTAEEVFDRVKALIPTISLATVYNCLDALVQRGLIKQVNFVREPTRYCPNLHEHAHFHDEATGEIQDIDIPADLMARLRALLPPGHKAVSIDLSFRGSAGSSDPIPDRRNWAVASVRPSTNFP
ncbi:MAG TPA: transcriptional repressor [Opitutaceae bacterium]|nr:transcriptional repressor [Opitutaceae bacterium]